MGSLTSVAVAGGGGFRTPVVTKYRSTSSPISAGVMPYIACAPTSNPNKERPNVSEVQRVLHPSMRQNRKLPRLKRFIFLLFTVILTPLCGLDCNRTIAKVY